MSLIYRSQKDSILHSMPIVYHGALSLSSHSGVGTVKMLGGRFVWDCPRCRAPESLRQEATPPHYDIIIICGLATRPSYKSENSAWDRGYLATCMLISSE